MLISRLLMITEPRWLCGYVSSNILHPWVDACEFNSACRRRLYMAAIFRYCLVYMFVSLLRLSIFNRLKKYIYRADHVMTATWSVHWHWQLSDITGWHSWHLWIIRYNWQHRNSLTFNDTDHINHALTSHTHCVDIVIGNIYITVCCHW